MTVLYRHPEIPASIHTKYTQLNAIKISSDIPFIHFKSAFVFHIDTTENINFVNYNQRYGKNTMIKAIL